MPREGETALRSAAARLAAFVNAPASQLAFIENATAGVQAALRSIDLQAGDRVLITNHTYNAMRLMVEARCAETGAKPLVVQIPIPASANDVVDRFKRSLTPSIRVAIVDHITSPTALVMPLERIIPELRSHNARVIVDGAHAVGQIPLDLAALRADWYVSNAHKWLFAPKGTAFLYASKDLAAKTRPNVVSHFIAMGFPASFDYAGTRDNSGWLSVPAALKFFESLGSAQMRSYQKHLLEICDEVFAPLGARAIAPMEMCAAMRTFVLPQTRRAMPEDGDTLVESLWNDHRIQVWSKEYEGQLLLRISAHVYVDEADVRRLRDVLEKDGWPGR
jgi:isopenicillin-N epimerase